LPKKLIWFSKTCFVKILQFFWSLCFISSHIKLKRKFLIKYFSPHFITAIIKLTVEHQKYQTVCAKNVWHIYWCFVSDFLAAFLFACHKIIHSFTRFKVNGFYRQIIFLVFVHNYLNSKRAVRLIFRSRGCFYLFFFVVSSINNCVSPLHIIHLTTTNWLRSASLGSDTLWLWLKVFKIYFNHLQYLKTIYCCKFTN